MLYTRVVAPGHWEIVGAPMDGGESRPLVTGPFRNGSATVSPDGRWLAYRSDETGEFEIYVQSYPGLGAKVPVSVGGGVEPVWSHDRMALYYRRSTDRGVVAVTIQDGTPPRVGRPEVLFRGLYVTGGAGVRAYDVAADGRFLMVGSATLLGERLNLVFVQNWAAEWLAR